MTDAFICDAIRTPIGRYGGALATVRADDLGAIPMKALMTRNADVDWTAVDDVIYGCGCHGFSSSYGEDPPRAEPHIDVGRGWSMVKMLPSVS